MDSTTTQNQITLDFGSFTLEATLFDSAIAQKFAANLPYKVKLEQWGDEVYGPIGIDLGEGNPVPQIPPGGIAYTNNGNYVCIFFGQTPAWPVEYIGQINSDDWRSLLGPKSIQNVVISCR